MTHVLQANELLCVILSQFVPFKKQYYRYVMKEKDTELHIFSSLRNGRVIAPALSQYSIRNLVV